MKKTGLTPGVLRYIPFLYVVWSDELLTPSEISVIKKNLENDQLDTFEKEMITQWLNPENPPKNEEIKEWKEIINASKEAIRESDNFPLTSFSERLTGNSNEKLSESLKSIEINLGIQPNHYLHLFRVKRTESTVSEPKRAIKLMNFLNGDNQQITDKIQSSIQQELFKYEIITNKEEYRAKVLKQLKEIASEGYGALAYPEKYGGENNMPGYGSIFENLIYVSGSLAVKFGVQFGLFGGSIYNLGTKKHHDKYLKSTGMAQTLGCFAMTETRHGSNVRGLKTTATYLKESDSIVIDTPGKNDNKEYIGNALHSGIATVFAQLIVNGKNEGVHAILVPVRDSEGNILPGIRIEDNGYKIGLNGVDNGKIWFSQVEVPRENLLDRFGSIDNEGTYHSPITNPNKRFFTMLGTLVGGRICVAKGALSGAKMALSIAVKYSLKRRQFNSDQRIQEELIMDYPSHQVRLIKPLAKSYIYHKALDGLMTDYNNSSEAGLRLIETKAAALKSTVTWFANQTIQECREACGGKGYLTENRIDEIRGDIDIFTTFEGDNTVLLQLAAKGLLTEFRSEFNNDSFTDILKYLGTSIGDRFKAFNPLFTNNVDKEHLYSTDFHLEALQYRRRRLTFSVASRLRNYIKKGIPSYHAVLKVQTHMITLGKAYASELAYQYFHELITSDPGNELNSLFRKLASVYALSEIEANADWYLEQGYISSNKSKAIKRRVERLCTELRPEAETLIDGFGIPDSCLKVPIL